MPKYRAVAFLLYNSAYNLQDLKFQNVKRSWLTPSSRTQVLGYVKTTVIVWTTWLLTNDEKSHLRDWIDGCPRLIAQHATWHGLVWIQCLLDVSVQNQHHHEKSLSNPNSHYLCIITRLADPSDSNGHYTKLKLDETINMSIFKKSIYSLWRWH